MAADDFETIQRLGTQLQLAIHEHIETLRGKINSLSAGPAEPLP